VIRLSFDFIVYSSSGYRLSLIKGLVSDSFHYLVVVRPSLRWPLARVTQPVVGRMGLPAVAVGRDWAILSPWAAGVAEPRLASKRVKYWSDWPASSIDPAHRNR